jgi:hypothetical protein
MPMSKEGLKAFIQSVVQQQGKKKCFSFFSLANLKLNMNPIDIIVLTHRQYLCQHYKKFDILDFYKYYNFMSRGDGEEILKKKL